MYYYNIAPATKNYLSKEALTYSSPERLAIGSIVLINILSKSAYGVVINQTTKPTFEAKNITEYTGTHLDKSTLKFFFSFNAYYPNFIGPVASQFLPSKLVPTQSADKVHRQEIISVNLNENQKKIIETIENSLDLTYLLHGATGSGKTRIYIQLIQKALARNTSALLLVPEISLTPKTISEIEYYFKNHTIITHHSKITASRKNKNWAHIASTTQPHIIIGTRSALFLPHRTLGLIIIDEFHDESFHQNSQPIYDTLRASALLSQTHNSKLILGSATPTVTQYYQLSQKKVKLLRIQQKAASSNKKVDVKIIDSSDINEKISASNILTKTLIQQIKNTLDNEQQVLLFINRRGTSRTIMCAACGWQSLCKNCNIPHVFHHDMNTYLCHECGQKSPPLYRCLACNSEQIFYKTGGTKLIEKEIHALFPTKNIARFDKDNNTKDHITSRYEEIESGKIDILIGTQILIKGHDFTNLGLVAMLQADTYLQKPDYTSSENLYQAVNQLLGRIDRGHNNGTFILQTHAPKSKVIAQALSDNWDQFYQEELNLRKKFRYPPYAYTLTVAHSMKSLDKLTADLAKLADNLREKNDVLVEGPTPLLYHSKDNTNHYQIIIKAKNRSVLLNIIESLPRKMRYELEPSHLI